MCKEMMDDDLLGKPGVWGTPHIRKEVIGAAWKIVYNGSSIGETVAHLGEASHPT
jgi:hypothetical protein